MAWFVQFENLRLISYNWWFLLGNGKGDCNYDLSPLNIVTGGGSQANTWTSTSYTSWGKLLITTPEFGITASSKRASVF